MDKKEIEKVVNKFLLSYGEEPNNYNEVFYNSKKNIGINVFMFLCDLAEDLSQPKEVDLDDLTALVYDLIPNGIKTNEHALQVSEIIIDALLPHLQTPIYKANLGMAKTSELIYELSARCDTGSIDKGGDYRSVDNN